MIEPEKEIVLTIAESTTAADIVDSITETVNLNEPGTCAGFIISLERLLGVAHMRCESETPSQENSEP